VQNWKQPKDGPKYRWTNHVGRKMRFYGLSPSRILRVVNAPERMEEGVVPGTLAGMQKAGTKAKPREIWAMWRPEKRNTSAPKGAPERKVIITAWRYPGTSPVRGSVPIPDEVLMELDAEGLLEG
jgi:hypothetical protein